MTTPLTPEARWKRVIAEAEAGDVEETLWEISQWLSEQHDRETHPEVRMLLISAADSVQAAAMDFYVSTK